ncbi:MAG: hypothetical protein LBR36_04180 [Bacteroidales bacterium]|jgi:hypothetical protein|nr:hypothetical protein [Bacteroidales bacterium]
MQAGRNNSLFSIFIILLQVTSACSQDVILSDLTLNIGEKYIFNCDCDFPSMSMMAEHHNTRLINDTLFFISFSANRQMMYVCNMATGKLRELPLIDIAGPTVRQLYYHNHDSVFFLFEEIDIFNLENKLEHPIADMLLINGYDGELLDEFWLRDVPYSYKGELSPLILLTGQHLTMNMIKGDNLLISYDIYKPKPTYDYNPKLLCSYNLKNHTLKMLNVTTPKEFIGKKYGGFYATQICRMQDGNLLLSFGRDGSLFKYDFDKDSMFCIYKDASRFFVDTDSATMQKRGKYLNVDFWDVNYCANMGLYCREIVVHNFMHYRSKSITEFWDTNFNHVGYCFGNKEYSIPYCTGDGVLRVFNKNTNQWYKVDSLRSTQRTLSEITNLYFIPLTSKSKKTR